MSEYGEPWLDEQGSPVKANGDEVAIRHNPTRLRIIACVNALASIKHPERLGELLEQVERYIKYGHGAVICDLVIAFDRLNGD